MASRNEGIFMDRAEAIQAVIGTALTAGQLQQFVPPGDKGEKLTTEVLLRVVMVALTALGVSEEELVKALINAPFLDIDPVLAVTMLNLVGSQEK